MRLRAFRFVSHRYTERERPSVVAKIMLFAVIVVTGIIWPMVMVAHAIRLIPLTRLRVKLASSEQIFRLSI